MAYKGISRIAWQQATIALLRYHDNISVMKLRMEVALTKDPEKSSSSGSKPPHSDITASAALRLMDDNIYQRAKREVTAVERVINNLKPEEVSVIQKRFWSDRNKKVVPYDDMQDMGYSTRQMKRIVKKTIKAIAMHLGEI